MRRGEKKKQGMRNTQVVYATWVIWVYSNQLERVTASRPTSAQSPGFLSGFSVNVRTYNMSGPSSSHSSWNEMKFSLTSICTQRWITPREKKKKKKNPSYAVDAVRACLTGRALLPLAGVLACFFACWRLFPFVFPSQGLWSREWRSWSTELSLSPVSSQRTLGITPACRPMACWPRPQLLPTSQWCVRFCVRSVAASPPETSDSACSSLCFDIRSRTHHGSTLRPTTKGIFEHIKTVLSNCGKIQTNDYCYTISAHFSLLNIVKGALCRFGERIQTLCYYLNEVIIKT